MPRARDLHSGFVDDLETVGLNRDQQNALLIAIGDYTDTGARFGPIGLRGSFATAGSGTPRTHLWSALWRPNGWSKISVRVWYVERPDIFVGLHLHPVKAAKWEDVFEIALSRAEEEGFPRATFKHEGPPYGTEKD